LVWKNRKKISQIINDYLCLPFFLLIILWPKTTKELKALLSFATSLSDGLDMQSFVVEASHQLEAINTPQFILYEVQAETVFQNVLREKCLYEKIRFDLSCPQR
jgi:hypothetical protein